MPTSTHQSDEQALPAGLPEAVAQILAIFGRREDTLRFPGIDAATLAGRAAGIDRLSQAVTEATLQLEAAERAKQAEEQALSELARRAYAYARVYAESDDELKRELESVDFGNRGKPRRKRGRAEGAPSPERRTTTTARSENGRAQRKTGPEPNVALREPDRVA